MANVVDTLITKYVLDDSQYKTGARGVTAATAGMSSTLSNGLGIVQAMVATMAAASAVTAGLAYSLMRGAGQFDSLVRSLESVEGSSAKAVKRLKELRDLAKAPGIGFEEAVQADVLLRRSGLSEQMSTAIMREFANQVAASGGGQEEFSRAMRAMMQISSKPFLQGDELLQLTEAGLPAHKMVRDAFGTSDTEELKRRGISSGTVIAALIAELEKTPRVAGGAKNAFENMDASIKQFMDTAGAALNQTLLPIIDNITRGIEQFNKGGTKAVFSAVAENVKSVFDAITSKRNLLIDLGALFIVATDYMRNFWLNLVDFVQWLAKVIPWMDGLVPGAAISKPAAQSFGESYAAARSGIVAAMMGQELLDRNAKPDADTGTPPAPNSIDSKIEENTRATASYTKQLADYTNQIFGGGTIGGKGITAVEVNDIKGRTAAGARGGSRIERAAVVLGEIFDEGVMEGIMRAKQSGLLN